MSRAIRVLVVDDSAYIRKVVKEMLSRSPAIEVVGTARDGEEALDQVERLEPDVVLRDRSPSSSSASLPNRANAC
jgi:two-component system, chemotaxis family, protein-glutamate methylesterase/glutaminase